MSRQCRGAGSGQTLEAIGDEPSGEHRANRHPWRAIATAGPGRGRGSMLARRQPCRRAATGGPAQDSAPRSHSLASCRGFSLRTADTHLNCSRNARRLCRRARVEAIGGQLSAEREKTTDRRRCRDDRTEIRCRSQPVVFELSVLWPDDHATVPLAGHQAMSTVPGTHQHDGRAIQLPAARGCALRRRLATQRRRCPRPRATVAATMRNVTTITAVQRALGVARIGAGDTVSDQRRVAELRIELRRARVLTLASKRLTASPSPLAVDGQAASRPSTAARASVSPRRPPKRGDSSRLQHVVPGRTRTDPSPDRAAR